MHLYAHKINVFLLIIRKAARYVRHCLDEVEDKQKRVEQFAEARKVRVDQFKQVYTCEKDAKQVNSYHSDILLFFIIPTVARP